MTHDILPGVNRRLFLRSSALGLGGVALSTLLADASDRGDKPHGSPGVLEKPHHEPKAKRSSTCSWPAARPA